jgi:segregation and condensation protein A
MESSSMQAVNPPQEASMEREAATEPGTEKPVGESGAEVGQVAGATTDESKPADAVTPASALDVLAYVNGQPYVDVPKDLFIPPEALEVILESFEGPLDLLLYLIRKNNLDILDVPVAEVTRQYMEYVHIMKQFHLELAADYLVMAALLGEIKSRCLLPRQVVEDDDEVDPRQELIRRLQEYERFKTAAEDIDAMPRLDRDIHTVQLALPNLPRKQRFPEVGMQELLLAFREVLLRANLTEHHHVAREKLSTRERMTRVLSRLRDQEYLLFPDLFEVDEGRGGVIVSFLAILELLKEGLIEVVQHEPFAAIYVAARTRVRTEEDPSLNALAQVLARRNSHEELAEQAPVQAQKNVAVHAVAEQGKSTERPTELVREAPDETLLEVGQPLIGEDDVDSSVDPIVVPAVEAVVDEAVTES